MQRATIALAVTLTFCAPASGQVFESVGPRALGMGGAFVAVADDATATYWNPAGLATGAIFDVGLGYGRNQHGSGENEPGPRGGRTAGPAFSLAFPAMGLSYNWLRLVSAGPRGSSTAGGPAGRQDLRPDEAGVSSLAAGQFGITLVQSVAPGLAVGTTLKLVRGTLTTGSVPAGSALETALEQAGRLEGRTSTAFDLDVGIMAALGPVRAGLTVRNAREPRFKSPSGGTMALHRQVRFGLAVMPGGDADEGRLVFSVDADLTTTPSAWGERRNVAFGAERWWLGRRLGLRAGARASTVGPARTVATAGVSVGLTRGTYLEASATGGQGSGDRGWAVGLRMGY